MKALLPITLVGFASANIIFNHVPLSCEPGSTQHINGKTGCLRGQVCSENGTCVAPPQSTQIPDLFRRGTTFETSESGLLRRAPAYSKDGKCGPKNGNTICDPNSKLYKGTCCSQHGWCGYSADYCNEGCISGCTKVTTGTQISTNDPRGNTAPSAAARKDGRCGKDYGGAACDSKGPWGTCCSVYGWCGNSPEHCLASNGCQFGCNVPSNPSSSGGSSGGSSNAPSGGSSPGPASSPQSQSSSSISQGNVPPPSSSPASQASSSAQSTAATGGGDAPAKPSSSTAQGSSPAAGGGSSAVQSSTVTQSSSAAQSSSATPASSSAADPKSSTAQSSSSAAQSSSSGAAPSSSSSAKSSSGSKASSSGQTGTTKVLSTSLEPVLGKPTTTIKSSGGGVTTDGTCGAANGNTVCGSWPQGGCCSMYGFCGNTTSHCGPGCQSGPCLQAPSVPAPGPSSAPPAATPGTLATVGMSGVPAMHAGLMPNGRVVFLDKVENYTQMKLSNGQYAYSSEYDPATNKAVPLAYKTNAFCSGGAFLPDGRWLSLGGNGPLDFIDPTVTDGFKAIRYISRSSGDAGQDGQAWSEPGNKLDTARWYASAQTMPDGTVFVASGSLNGLDPTKPENNNPTWEVLNNQGVSNGVSVPMDILAKNQPYYMYPFIHLMSDGNLFVFTSKSSESFNVAGNKTNTQYPDLSGDHRTYPNTGGSVLLPLNSKNKWAPDIIICGGGAYQDITSPTDASCGRIQPLADNPTWEMDSMPEGRGMVEGTLLPDGTVIWVNGCNLGAQGFGLGASPTYGVLIYDPSKDLGQRWSTGPTSGIARLYHSVALLLLDGTLMITGSNPVEQPVLTPVPNQVPSEDYVTEFRVEIYTPPYLQGGNAKKRPTDVAISSLSLSVGSTFTISFTAPSGNKGVQIALYHGGFVTHSLHMNHRMAFLDNTGYQAGGTTQKLTVNMPPNSNVAPPGPYVMYVVVDGIPGIGQFVSVK